MALQVQYRRDARIRQLLKLDDASAKSSYAKTEPVAALYSPDSLEMEKQASEEIRRGEFATLFELFGRAEFERTTARLRAREEPKAIVSQEQEREFA